MSTDGYLNSQLAKYVQKLVVTASFEGDFGYEVTSIKAFRETPSVTHIIVTYEKGSRKHFTVRVSEAKAAED